MAPTPRLAAAFRATLLLPAFLLLPSPTSAQDLLPPGHRPEPPGVHALVGGRVVVRPGKVLDAATIVLRDGIIEAVGPDVAPPPDARIWDLKGLTVYAGFIDPYLDLKPAPPRPPKEGEPAGPMAAAGTARFFGVPGAGRDPGSPGPGYPVARITPERRVARTYAPDPKTLESLRELGFTAANVVPEAGIIRGTSAFVTLADVDPNRAVLKPDVFLHIAFERESEEDGHGYPSSLMGQIAAIRQAFFDAQHYALDQANYAAHPGGRKRPDFDPALAALAPALARELPVVFEVASILQVDQAARIARELGLRFLLAGSGQEWRRPDLVKAAGVPFLLPLAFPELPALPEDDDWIQLSLDQLRAWDWAPENPALVRMLGLGVALTPHGLKDRGDFRKHLRWALDRGLAEDDALAALTVLPARLAGLEERLGTLEPGKIANLTIVKGGSWFDPETRVREVWIDGRVCPVSPGRKDKDAEGAPEKPAGERKESPDEVRKKEEEKRKQEEAKAEREKKRAELSELRRSATARSPQAGRGPIEEPPAVFVQGATVWTSGPQGRLEHADLLCRGGKVVAVGRGLAPPPECAGGRGVIDGRGRHVTPGLIDCHSHTAIVGDVNEGTLPSTAMVRIGDVVNSETATLYEQLAGGLTATNLLHGSANPIGGQNQVIKLRDGAAPEELKLAGAPPGIKFALGENVKQSNWGEKHVTRFPQTRMGVRTFFANRFLAARRYLADWEAYRKAAAAAAAPDLVPPRRDLELEALGEILEGKRLIHCHSYRQDEILMLIRLMESFGVKIGSFQHVLEGYKVADEIAAHGAGASCFSDWWAYKFEVYDAIPYAGSLMRERGVVTSFNSDSSELARRLYLEAAKAVKYGGTPEEQALELVTLNPARQLRIDASVGSLEPGKDADFVVWSESPLAHGTVCLQTWIDGRKYFDRALDPARVEARVQERAALIAKAKRIRELAPFAAGEKEQDKEKGGGGDSGGGGEIALEHEHDYGWDVHCEGAARVGGDGR